MLMMIMSMITNKPWFQKSVLFLKLKINKYKEFRPMILFLKSNMRCLVDKSDTVYFS